MKKNCEICELIWLSAYELEKAGFNVAFTGLEYDKHIHLFVLDKEGKVCMEFF